MLRPTLAQDVTATSRAMTADDPNANAAWDWTVNQRYTLYTPSGSIPNVPLPYFSADGPVRATVTPLDVRPQDGWTLLYRDFGTPSASVSTPRFILYNKYTGTLRLFLYNYKIFSDYNAALVRLKTIISGAGSTPPPMLTYYRYGNGYEFLNDYNPDREVMAVTDLERNAWAYADFQLPIYVPNIGASKYTDAFLQFKLVGIKEEELRVKGDVNLEALYSEGTTNFFESFSTFASGFPGDKASDFLKRFKDKDSAADDQANRAEEEGKTSVKNEIINLASQALSSYLPGLGGVAGFIGNLVGGTSRPQLTGFNGTVTLTGDITSRFDLSWQYLRLPGTQRTDDVGAPLRNVPLGMFGANQPTMDALITEDCSYDRYEVECDIDGTYTLTGLETFVNPEFQDNIKSFEVALEYPNGSSTNFVDVNNFGALPDYTCSENYYYQDGASPLTTQAAKREAETASALQSSNPCSSPTVSLRLQIDPDQPVSDFVPVTFIQSYRPDVTYPSTQAQAKTNRMGDPASFEIVSTGPNPFQASTTVAFTLPDAQTVTAALYDVMGRRVRTLAHEAMSPGRHELTVRGGDLPSGTYFYRIQAGDRMLNGKVVRLR